MARNRTIKLCSHWVARLAGVALLLSASMAQAGLITIDVTGVTSNGQLGSAGNTVLTVDLNQALGTTAGSEVTIEVLHERGLIPKKATHVKLLGNGELKTSLKVKLHRNRLLNRNFIIIMWPMPPQNPMRYWHM